MATVVELGHRASFRLGRVEVRPSSCEVEGPGGRETVEPKVMQVLVALADARGETLTRDDLTRLCWDGRVVGNDAINRVVLKIRQLGRRVGQDSFSLQTIRRVGYRLLEEGVAQPVPDVAPALDPRPSPEPRLQRLSRASLVAGMLTLLLAGLVLVRWFAPPAAEPASLAVLPFRELSGGDGYFAAGLGEELLGQLAREPQLRVVRRAGTARPDEDGDPGAIGRRYRVAHVLEGAVRRDGARLRVDVALVRTADSARLWADRFDGDADDVFGLQQRIAGAVVEALRLRIDALAGVRRTRGDVYALYLTARGLIRTRQPAKIEAAIDLLRQALALDPRYAPAWSTLAAATALRATGNPRTAGENARQSLQLADRALALAPDLAEAHATRAFALGFETDAGLAALRRAAALDGRNPEIQLWLGNALGMQQRFEEQARAYARAAALDPAWVRPGWAHVDMAWTLGDRDAALDFVRRAGRQGDPIAARALAAQLAEVQGDFARARRLYQGAWQVDPERADRAIRFEQASLAPALGLPLDPDDRRVLGPVLSALLDGQQPTVAELASRMASRDQRMMYLAANRLGVKRLLAAGRGAELAALYDRVPGLLGLAAGAPPTAFALADAPLVALALQAAAREREAAQLLGGAAEIVAAARARGRTPPAFDVAAAAVFAVAGRDEAALAALERAASAGWLPGRQLDELADIGAEPSFAALRGHPRFERLRAALAARLAAQRRAARG
jgi:TolB-like protein/DNA-binding winged helix-turn-helix (wHTH) protein/Tfp pilus assembly protein PilF